MQINVIKRNGEKEIFNPDKILEIVQFACDGLENVSSSEVVMKSRIQLVDGITTQNLHDLTVRSAHDLISEETPDYQYVAGRLLAFDLRKKVFGSFKPKRLFTMIQQGIDIGLYSPELLTMYTEKEWDNLDSYIVHERDFNYTYAAMNMWMDKYLVKDRSTGKFIETPQVAGMLLSAVGFSSYPKETRLKYVKKFYNNFSLDHYSLPTPVVAGVRTKLKQYSSCTLIASGDSLDSITAAASSIVQYSSRRAGIGIDMGRVRAVGSKVRDGLATTTGAVPFLKFLVSALKSCSQGGLRNSSSTINFPIWHKEIEALLVLKNDEGTEDNRERKSDYCFHWNQYLIKRALNGEKISLFCPNDVPDLHSATYSKDPSLFIELYEKYENDETINKKQVPGEELLKTFLIERKKTGRIYSLFSDEVSRRSQFLSPYNVTQTNLCCISSDSLIKIKDIENGVVLTLPIKTVVEMINEGDKLQVYSYNIEKNMLEFNDIVSGCLMEKNAEVYELVNNSTGSKLIITGDHKVFTSTRGYIKVKDILDSDIIFDIKETNNFINSITINKLIGLTDVYDIQVKNTSNFFANDILIHNCEIVLPTIPDTKPGLDDGVISLCTLASYNLGKYKTQQDMKESINLLVRYLDNLLTYQDYPLESARRGVKLFRPLGIGLINYAYYLAKNDLYDVTKAREKMQEIGESLYYYALEASVELAEEKGKCDGYSFTTYSKGILNIDNYNPKVDELVENKLNLDWKALRRRIKKSGVRNATLLAIAPTESSSVISNSTSGIELIRDYVVVKDTKGQKTKQVVPELNKYKDKYVKVFDLNPTEFNEFQLANMAILQKFICQSISIYTYLSDKYFKDKKIPFEVLLEQFLYPIKYGIKTLYYSVDDTENSSATQVEQDEAGCESCKL